MAIAIFNVVSIMLTIADKYNFSYAISTACWGIEMILKAKDMITQ